jgi:hypothetical protein
VSGHGGGLSQDRRRRARQLANLQPGRGAARPGDQRARKHGAKAAAVLARDMDAKVREIFEAIGQDLPVTDESGQMPPADAPAVKLLAEVLVRLDGIASYIRDRGQVDPKTGKLRESLFALERSLRNEARDHLEGLALNPRSRYRIGVDYVRGRSVIEAMEADWHAEQEEAEE